MKRLRFAAAAVLLAFLALPGTPAGAAEGVTVRNVDTREYPTVRLEVLVSGEAPKTTDFHLRENGKSVIDSSIQVRPLKQTAKPVGTVLVMDTSGSMRTRGAIDQAKAAARTFIAAKSPNDWIALVAFSNQAVTSSDFTQDANVLNAAVDSLAATGETALWDGVIMGARLFEKRTDLQPNLVLLSDGADTVSVGTEQQATAALNGAHAAVFAVGIASDEFDPGSLSNLVGTTGGSLSTSADPADLSGQFTRIRAAIENQYEVIYTSAGQGGSLALDLAVGAVTTQVQTRAGTVSVAAKPRVVTSDGGLFPGSSGKFVIPLLAMLTAGLLGFALLLIFGRNEQSIEGRLGHVTASPEAAVDGRQLSRSMIVQRAVAITSKLAQRGQFLDKVGALLEQANVSLRPAEALFFYGAGVILVGALAMLGAPSLAVGLMFVVIIAVTPIAVLRLLTKRRLKAFEGQLPDTLNLLAGSLKSGYSFMQGVEAVAQETTDPMARELRRVIAEARLGRPLEDALSDVATRMQSTDFEWSVLAIRIQREVGGNLAELLQTVSDTMIMRGRLRGEVKALTAEGRLSAIIMGLMPVGLGGFLFVSNPDYIGELFSSALGWGMVAGSTVAALAGFAWLQKIIKIEV
jgi:tight adherence protein B